MKKVSSSISPHFAIDPHWQIPLYRQIYNGYRNKIINGNLRPGQRVPSSRMLAAELGISRIPVLNAYAQLVQEGYFDSRVGAGTVVASSLPEMAPSVTGNIEKSKVGRGLRSISNRYCNLPAGEGLLLRRGIGAFAVGQVAFEHFPHRVWNSLVNQQCRGANVRYFDYENPMGLDELREAVAMYLRTARCAQCEAEQIMIVSGSQQALEIATRVLLDPGAPVWIEEPGYRLAREVFAFNECQVIPVPVDYEGLNVAAGVERCGKARAVLVTPSHQYPLGVVMSATRRFQLLEWAEHSGAWIIEDDYDSEFRYESAPIPCLQGLDRNCRVIYIGTFSKVLFPSLRLGYLIIPPDLINKFLTARVAMDIASPRLYQSVLADFIAEGHFARHIRRMRLVYRERRSVLDASIKETFRHSADITGGEAGMHLAVTLNGIDDREISNEAKRQRLWLTSLSSAYVEKPTRQGFILGFGSTQSNEIPPAVHKLHTLIRSH